MLIANLCPNLQGKSGEKGEPGLTVSRAQNAYCFIMAPLLSLSTIFLYLNNVFFFLPQREDVIKMIRDICGELKQLIDCEWMCTEHKHY